MKPKTSTAAMRIVTRSSRRPPRHFLLRRSRGSRYSSRRLLGALCSWYSPSIASCLDARPTRNPERPPAFRCRRSSRRLSGISYSWNRCPVTLEEPDVRRRPEDRERLALDALDGRRSEKARVAGVGPVVAQNNDHAFRHSHRVEGAAGDLVLDVGPPDVGLLQTLEVHIYVAVVESDMVPRQPYHALYQVLLAVLGALEDDDVAPLGLGEAVDELVDEYPVSDLERRDHALRRDVESLEDVRAHEAEDQGEGDDEYDQELHEAPAFFGRAALLGRYARLEVPFVGVLLVHGRLEYRTWGHKARYIHSSQRALSSPLRLRSSSRCIRMSEFGRLRRILSSRPSEILCASPSVVWALSCKWKSMCRCGPLLRARSL